MGRSDIFLKREIIKKVIGVTALLISIQYGVLAIALTGIITGIISTFINAYPNGYLLNYKYWEQVKDILPSILCASVMALAVYFIGNFAEDVYSKLLIQIIVGILSYVLISKLFKLNSFKYIVALIKEKFIKG